MNFISSFRASSTVGKESGRTLKRPRYWSDVLVRVSGQPMKAAIESEVRTMNMKVTTDYFHVRPLTLAAHSNNCQRLAICSCGNRRA